MMNVTITQASILAALAMGGFALFQTAQLDLKKEELAAVQRIADERQNIIDEQNVITRREARIDNNLNAALREVKDIPNAQTLVPTDVALALNDVLVSVRDDEGAHSDRSTKVLQRSGHPRPPTGGADLRSVDRVFRQREVSVCEM